MIFAKEMLEVYQSFCQGKGWQVRMETLNLDSGGKALKLGKMKVSGVGCYKRLRCESGVHK